MHNKCECDKATCIPDSPPDTARPILPLSYTVNPPYLPMKQQDYSVDQTAVVKSIFSRSEDVQESMLHHFAAVVTSSQTLSKKAHGDIPLNKVVSPISIPISSCCSSKKKADTIENEKSDNLAPCCGSPPEKKQNVELEPCCTNSRPCASGAHKDPEKRNRIVLVTCRCGDDCACPGCDVHPSKVMKGRKDPYAGYTSSIGEATVIHRKPSIENDSSQVWKSPTAVFNEHGVMLCGCGCDRPFDSCRGCEHGLY